MLNRKSLKIIKIYEKNKETYRLPRQGNEADWLDPLIYQVDNRRKVILRKQQSLGV